MKQVTITLLLLFISFCGFSQGGTVSKLSDYTIKGIVQKDVKDGSILYLMRNGNFKFGQMNSTIAETTVKGGKFEIKGQCGKCDSVAFINVGKNNYNVIIEPGTIIINDIEKTVKGTKLNEHLQKYSYSRNAISKQYNTECENVSKDSTISPNNKIAGYKVINEKYQPIFRKNIEEYIKGYENTSMAEYMIFTEAIGISDCKEFDDLYSIIGFRAVGYGPLKGLITLNEKIRKTQPGAKFIDFTIKDGNLDGSAASLSDYVGKGKYILVDFWASWCGWCRAEFPNLAETYKKFKGDNFEIVGVVVNDKLESTKKALSKEPLCTWPQIVNCGKTPMDLYGVDGIPQIILFAPDGTILARNLRGAEVQNVVEKALKGEFKLNNESKKYTVKGRIPENLSVLAKGGKTVKISNPNSRRDIATCEINENKLDFEFNGTIEGSDSLCILEIGANRLSFILQPGIIAFDDSFNPSGTPLNDEYSRFSGELSKVFNGFSDQYKKLMADSTVSASQKNQKYKAFDEDFRNMQSILYKKYLETNKNNALNALLIAKWVGLRDDIAVFDEAWKLAGDYAKSYNPLLKDKARMDVLRNVQEKMKFTDFTIEKGSYPDFKTVKFSDYIGKGKYVLVDFWASWCGPCRGEIPNIKKVYERFHGDKFDCLSLAVWDKHDATIKAIKDENMPWPQIIDCKDIPTTLYGIIGIPQIILFGPDGTIVAKNLRGENVMNKVEEVLSK